MMENETLLSPLGPPPPPSSDNISKTMKANKAKDTKPERIMRHALREIGLPGYRLNWSNVPGRPDICYPGRRIAIFIHGCFWHRCPYCNLLLPKSNREFWKKKFHKNKLRDARKEEELINLGWKVFIFWECEILNDSEGCAMRVLDFVDNP